MPDNQIDNMLDAEVVEPLSTAEAERLDRPYDVLLPEAIARLRDALGGAV